MLYGLIRFILILFILILIFCMLKKRKIIQNKNVSALICVVGLIFGIVFMFPIENLFINFKTPQDIFWYTHFGKIEDILYGDDSCMIVYSKGNNAYSRAIIPKSENGYQIPSFFTTNVVTKLLDENGIFEVYNIPQTNDYYIYGATIALDGEVHFDCNNNEDAINNLKILRNTSIYYSFFQMK